MTEDRERWYREEVDALKRCLEDLLVFIGNSCDVDPENIHTHWIGNGENALCVVFRDKACLIRPGDDINEKVTNKLL